MYGYYFCRHRTCEKIGEQNFHMYGDTSYDYHDFATRKMMVYVNYLAHNRLRSNLLIKH